MYISLTETWIIPVKTAHEFRLDAREGFFQDTVRLYVDKRLVVAIKVGIFNLRGYELFAVDGRELEFRWQWSWLSGNPVSIVIMHKGRILAQSGNSNAADDSDEDYDYE